MKTKSRFNCFAIRTGSKHVKAASELSERRSKHARKSVSSKPKIEPDHYAGESRGKPEAFVRIVSVSNTRREAKQSKGWPEKDAKIEEEVTVLGQRSWVRFVVSDSEFSSKKNQDGMAQRDEHKVSTTDGEVKATAKPNILAIHNGEDTARDSSLGPFEQQSVACTHIPILGPEAKAIDFEGQVNAPARALCMLPHINRIQVSSQGSNASVLEPNKNLENLAGGKEGGNDAVLSLSFFIMIMLCLVLCGKLVAIVCTCVWLYAVAKLRIKEMERVKNIERDKQKV